MCGKTGQGDVVSHSEVIGDCDFIRTNGGLSTLSAMLQALGNQRRRYAVYYLRDQQTATIDELALYIAKRETDHPSKELVDELAEEIRIELYHSHLPKLADALIVEYDDRTHTARYTRPPDSLEEVLDVTIKIEQDTGNR